MKKHLNMRFTVLMLSLCWLASSTVAASPNIESKSVNTQLDDKQSNSMEEKHHSSHHYKNMSKEEMQALKLTKMKKLAAYFEIETEGKSVKQLRAEIEQAKKDQPEKWEMFKQQFRAKKLEEMREFAKSQGISIEGKTEQQLREELHKLKHHEQEQ